MTNAEIIKALRCCASPHTSCKGLCSYHGVEYCLSKKDLDAADALEVADKLNAELIKNIEHWKKDVVELRSQLQKNKSRIYDLESMAKSEYDDDPDNEYLEGYFDGLHQAAKLISTTLTIEKGEQDE